MKIKLSDIDRESFVVHEHLVDGHKCYLVQPQHIGCKWTRENSIFRSSLWDEEGNLISASWKKFVNWGEKPDIFPAPTSIAGCNLIAKEDGSTLIISKSPWSGKLIFRTRGTVDAQKLDNGHEINTIIKKYPSLPLVLQALKNVGIDASLLFEWVSSENVIVLKYSETPDIILTGIVIHSDYSYFTQEQLDMIASTEGFKRPKVYSFASLEELQAAIPSMKGIEGICVYYNNDQDILKCKTEEYLKLHRFKEKANLDSTLDLFMELGRPTREQFADRLISQFDFECFQLVKEFIEPIVSASDKMLIYLLSIQHAVSGLSDLSRKDAALEIIRRFPDHTGIAFCFLGGKTIPPKTIRELIYAEATRIIGPTGDVNSIIPPTGSATVDIETVVTPVADSVSI